MKLEKCTYQRTCWWPQFSAFSGGARRGECWPVSHQCTRGDVRTRWRLL